MSLRAVIFDYGHTIVDFRRTEEALFDAYQQIRARIAAMPQVVAAGISTNATPPANGGDGRIEIMGASESGKPVVRVNFISPEYFPVLRIPLAQGRMWDQAETMRGAQLAAINQTMARQYWPKGDAIGRQLRIPALKNEPPYSPAAHATPTKSNPSNRPNGLLPRSGCKTFPIS